MVPGQRCLAKNGHQTLQDVCFETLFAFLDVKIMPARFARIITANETILGFSSIIP